MNQFKIKIYIKFVDGEKVIIPTYVDSGDMESKEYITSLSKFAIGKADRFFPHMKMQSISFYIGALKYSKLCYMRD